MRKRKKYIDYDYDEIFNESLDNMEESQIIAALKRKEITSVYATKTIKSGNQLEVEIYPEFSKRKQITDSERIRKRKDIQNNLNAKNARKSLIRLINTNFDSNDYFLTFTFAEEPESEERAMKDIKNYLERINRLRKKKGLENAKYIYVLEMRKRWHVHMIMERGLTMDEMESKWTKARRNNCRRLDPTTEDGLIGLATYLSKESKDSKYKKKWVSSRNLKKPVIHKNHTSFSNRKVKQMVKDAATIPIMMEKKFNAEYRDVEIKHNSFNGKWYLYIRMYFKE